MIVLRSGCEDEPEVRSTGGGALLVTRAKKASSVLSGGQGRVPRNPKPREGVVARIRVRGRREGISEGFKGNWVADIFLHQCVPT